TGRGTLATRNKTCGGCRTEEPGCGPGEQQIEQLQDPQMLNIPTLAALADDLGNGRTTARKIVDGCLARIADKSGEGARTFIHVDAEAPSKRRKQWTGCARSTRRRRLLQAFPFPSRTCLTSGARSLGRARVRWKIQPRR